MTVDPMPPAGRPDTAGVLAPPPAIFAAALVLGWLLGLVVPLPGLASGIAMWIGMVLVVLAVAAIVASKLAMGRVHTPVNPYQPSTALVRAGPYRYSRNPIYVAMMGLSLGVALLAGSLWMALLLIPAVAVLRSGVVAREEAYLERKFGEDYRHYTAEVRRWL